MKAQQHIGGRNMFLFNATTDQNAHEPSLPYDYLLNVQSCNSIVSSFLVVILIWYVLGFKVLSCYKKSNPSNILHGRHTFLGSAYRYPFSVTVKVGR